MTKKQFRRTRIMWTQTKICCKIQRTNSEQDVDIKWQLFIQKRKVFDNHLIESSCGKKSLTTRIFSLNFMTRICVRNEVLTIKKLVTWPFMREDIIDTRMFSLNFWREFSCGKNSITTRINDPSLTRRVFSISIVKRT